MSDTIQTTAAASGVMDTAKVTAATSDVVSAVTEAKKVLTAYKSGGFSAVSALLGEVVTEIEKDWTDISAAIPSIKSGYKTTEFWLVVGLGLGNGVYAAIAGKALPFDLNAVLGAIIVVYTAARALTKSSSTTAAAVVAAK